MTRARIDAELSEGTYFVTFTTMRWYYLFDRHDRWDILADSLSYCQQHKGLEINGYVFMLNHCHMIFTSPDSIGLVRDFKRQTTKDLKANIQKSEPRVLELFQDDRGAIQIWQSGNAPKRIENPAFYLQKLEYLHNNPVRKRYVARPEHWVWSSANPDSPLRVNFFSS